MDEEVEKTADNASSLLGLLQAASSNDKSGASDGIAQYQNGILMAAVKADVANAQDLFNSVILDNHLAVVDPARPPLAAETFSRAAGAEPATSAETLQTPQLQKTPQLQTESDNRTRFWYQPPAKPGNTVHANSLVLFVTLDEANQIVATMQEKGLVSSPVWKVENTNAKQLSNHRLQESTDVAAAAPNEPVPEALQSKEKSVAARSVQGLARTNSTNTGKTDSPAVAGQAEFGRPSNGREKVILMLNMPPQ